MDEPDHSQGKQPWKEWLGEEEARLSNEWPQSGWRKSHWQESVWQTSESGWKETAWQERPQSWQGIYHEDGNGA
jgi:hypothetical protein